MTDPLLIAREGAIAILTMNRPEAMNALSLALRGALVSAFRMLGADDEIRVIILTGAGERAFTAGLDLKEIGAGDGAAFGGAYDLADNNPVAALRACGKPVLGAINGAAITGGFELALACDLMIAASTARFADTHVKVKVMPGWGLSQRLPRLIGIARATQMSLTGAFIDAETALAWGLVNEVVPPDRLLPRALEIATAIAAHDPAMVARYRAMIDEGMSLPFGEALALEAARAQAFNEAIPATAIEEVRAGVFESNRGPTSSS
jgi:enoyl-CoA hydratase